MKKALAVVLALLLVGASAGGSQAQVRFIQVYFDSHFTETQTFCRPAGSVSSLYVAAQNLNMYVSAIDFKVLFPTALLWSGDSPIGASAVIGNSMDGIAITYGFPQLGYVTMYLDKITVEWTADCDCQGHPQAVRVVGYDDLYSPVPRVVSWPDNNGYDCVGMTSLICPGEVSTEPTTWGGVKALYR